MGSICSASFGATTPDVAPVSTIPVSSWLYCSYILSSFAFDAEFTVSNSPNSCSISSSSLFTSSVISLSISFFVPLHVSPFYFFTFSIFSGLSSSQFSGDQYSCKASDRASSFLTLSCTFVFVLLPTTVHVPSPCQSTDFQLSLLFPLFFPIRGIYQACDTPPFFNLGTSSSPF